jgi:hypothetical protein
MKWQQVTVRMAGIWLMEDGAPIIQHHRIRVIESPDARKRSEVVVKGTVLLHEQYYMFDVLEGTTARGCGFQCFSQMGRNKGGH